MARKKQSPTRNADTQFISRMRRDNEVSRQLRSQRIREREQQRREALLAEARALQEVSR